ncbi:hypothetical protein ERJ75_001372900 [Trypanosoma vivax]|nr:hypothetical protein ERJ75_001372900 [Trypanosoma vivax]
MEEAGAGVKAACKTKPTSREAESEKAQAMGALRAVVGQFSDEAGTRTRSAAEEIMKKLDANESLPSTWQAVVTGVNHAHSARRSDCEKQRKTETRAKACLFGEGKEEPTSEDAKGVLVHTENIALAAASGGNCGSSSSDGNHGSLKRGDAALSLARDTVFLCSQQDSGRTECGMADDQTMSLAQLSAQ